MVLGGRPPGRVGRRRISQARTPRIGAFGRVLDLFVAWVSVVECLGADSAHMRPFHRPRRAVEFGPRLEYLCRTTAAHPPIRAVRSDRNARVRPPARAERAAPVTPAGRRGVAPVHDLRRPIDRVVTIPLIDPGDTPSRMIARVAMVALVPVRRDAMAARAVVVARRAVMAIRASDRAATAIRANARRLDTTAGALAGVLPDPMVHGRVTGGRVAMPSRGLTATMAGAAGLPLGAIPGLCGSKMANALAGTTHRERNQAVAPVGDLVDATGFHRGVSRPRGPLLSSARPRSKPPAVCASPVNKQNLRHGNASNGSTTVRCDPPPARPPPVPSGPNLTIPVPATRSRQVDASHPTWLRRSQTSSSRQRPPLAPPSTRSV